MKIINASHKIASTNKNWKRKKKNPKGFPVSTEPEQSHVKTSPACPHRDSPIKAPLLILSCAAPSPNWVGDKWLTLWLLGFLDSTQATILPTHYNWDYYCSLELYTHIHSWQVFLIKCGHTLVFCRRLWNISSAKVVGFLGVYMHRRLVFISFSKDELSDLICKAK